MLAGSQIGRGCRQEHEGHPVLCLCQHCQHFSKTLPANCKYHTIKQCKNEIHANTTPTQSQYHFCFTLIITNNVSKREHFRPYEGKTQSTPTYLHHYQHHHYQHTFITHYHSNTIHRRQIATTTHFLCYTHNIQSRRPVILLFIASP